MTTRAALNLSILLATLIAAPAAAQVTAYTDEALFLADMAASGWCVDVESVESDAAWGAARTPATLPSVTNLGLTWLPNNGSSGLSTSGGSARTGVWGFFEYPHGDFGNGFESGDVSAWSAVVP